MRKFSLILFMMLLLCVGSHAQAKEERLNIYLNKEALLAHDVNAADIRIRPEGKVRVTRHSLWPHDEDGTAFTLFVEIENTSDEKIVLDNNWLYACKANRDEIAVANTDSSDDPMDWPTRVVYPGEKVVIHAGILPWLARTGEKNFREIYGLSDFAGRIRQAKVLRLRFEHRGNDSYAKCYRVDIEANAWIDGNMLFFETANNTNETVEYYHAGVIVSDKEGRIIDLLSTFYVDDAKIEPGQTLSIQKELQPYITPEMIDGATFEVFAYTL